MNLFGNCVVCGKYLGHTEYEREEVVAAVGAEGAVVCCVSHVDGGPSNPEYQSTLDKIALAKTAQLQKN